jgi:hypothetical protein
VTHLDEGLSALLMLKEISLTCFVGTQITSSVHDGMTIYLALEDNKK